MLPPQFDYAAPRTIQDAFKAIAGLPDAMVVTGSYREIVDLKMRRITPPLLVDLRRIPELYGIAIQGNGVRIGAMTTLRTIMDDTIIQSRYAALADAALASGDPQMRNMESLGASFTYDVRHSDTAAALLALNAVIHVAGMSAERTVAASVFTATGLTQGEIITGVSLPASSGISAYEKYKHPATLVAVCGVAVNVTLDENKTVQQCAIAVTGATDHPVRLSRAESELRGSLLNATGIDQAATAGGENLEFITDLDFSGEYRSNLLKVLLKRLLTRIA
jgi:carbon-monoxide dehydrogenase medium subunit